ncbi:carboxylate--amine ligase [Undibacterium sp. Jales W-56]|uniref:carboxylate--amine ligase n=1 Tax=Undibacterium sp. Jales W-56 TaxID=2897325 RepID=UPI0021D26B12|nr:carboxylate--amine ligase [Undibacterium sp. Jales W-56]MCU6434131.1 carboxylate--amine ligase [Undibacterium sp. Jales W-56]
MMPHYKSDQPAVVLGGGVNALGIVRSLGSAGVAVLVMDSDIKSPAMLSRYGRKIHIATLEGQALVDRLLAFARDYSVPLMLFATEEKTVRTISGYRDQLSAAFRLRLPQHERLMALMHKQGFQELAEANHAPIPKTIRLQSPDDLAQAAQLKFPCVLKPSEKNYAYGARFKKAYKVLSAEELRTLYLEIHPVLADMVVQEWIEGKDSEIYFCLQYLGKQGELVASFTGRKIRSWPIRIGGTASCTAAWEYDQELTEKTKRFFDQVEFTGMGSMEYKRDERDGQFYMIEPTVARTDFQEEVATLNGVNIPLAAYLYENGLPPVSAQQAEPAQQAMVWRDPQSDRWAFEEGGHVVDERSQSLPVADAYWRWSDPLPWVYFMWDRVMQRFSP